MTTCVLHMQAAVDELGTWGRPLSAAEVAALATSNAPLALATATGFTTYNLFRVRPHHQPK